MNLSKKKLAIIALIIANIIWGIGPSIFKWSFADIHLFTLAFLRFFIPTCIIAFLFPRHIFIRKKDFLRIALVGIFSAAINVYTYFLAIEETASINAPIIASAGPVFLIFGSMLLLKEKPTKKMLLGNLVGITGILLIVVQPLLQHSPDASVVGNLLLIVSTLSSETGTIFAKGIMKKYSAITIGFWSFLIGSICFFPLFVNEVSRYGFLPHINYQGVIAILFGSIFSSFFGYILFYWALKHLLATQTSVYTYLDPIAGIFIAIPLLHEYPSVIFLLGSFLVLFGIYIAEKRINYHPFHKLFVKDRYL